MKESTSLSLGGPSGRGLQPSFSLSGFDYLPSVLVALFTTIWLVAALRFPGFTNGDEVELLNMALQSAGYLDYQPWPIRHLFLGELVGSWLSLWTLELTPLQWLLLATLPSILGSVATLDDHAYRAAGLTWRCDCWKMSL